MIPCVDVDMCMRNLMRHDVCQISEMEDVCNVLPMLQVMEGV